MRIITQKQLSEQTILIAHVLHFWLQSFCGCSESDYQFNRAVSEDFNLHSTTVSENHQVTETGGSRSDPWNHTTLSTFDSKWNICRNNRNVWLSHENDSQFFESKASMRGLLKPGDQKSFICTLWVKWSLFSVKVYACTATSQLCLVGFARRLLHSAACRVFLFFRLLFDAEKIYLWKEEVQRKVTVPFQGTHSNIITLLSVYESSELWHKHVPAPPHSAITPQKGFLYRHSVQRARGRQPPTGVNGSRMWVWDRLRTNFSWFQVLALGDMVGADLSDTKCSPHLLLLGKWAYWNILLVTVKEIFWGERRIIAMFFLFLCK